MESQADLLVFTDDDKLYGIEKGYYPDIKRAVDSGSMTVIPYSDVSKTQLRLRTAPLMNGEDVYLRNPFTNCYISASDNELLDEFCESKGHVIKEAFVWMGAKDIILKETINDRDDLKVSGGLEGGAGSGKGSMKCNFNKLSTVDISNLIESHDPGRTPKDIDKVESYLYRHGLANETKLVLLAERLREEGQLSGIEKYSVKYLNEIQVALKMLASFDYKVFSSKLDFSREHNTIHTFTQKIEIVF